MDHCYHLVQLVQADLMVLVTLVFQLILVVRLALAVLYLQLVLGYQPDQSDQMALVDQKDLRLLMYRGNLEFQVSH